MKTSLKKTNVGRPVIYSPACLLDVSSVHPLNLLSLCLLLLSTMVKESSFRLREKAVDVGDEAHNSLSFSEGGEK